MFFRISIAFPNRNTVTEILFVVTRFVRFYFSTLLYVFNSALMSSFRNLCNLEHFFIFLVNLISHVWTLLISFCVRTQVSLPSIIYIYLYRCPPFPYKFQLWHHFLFYQSIVKLQRKKKLFNLLLLRARVQVIKNSCRGTSTRDVFICRVIWKHLFTSHWWKDLIVSDKTCGCSDVAVGCVIN